MNPQHIQNKEMREIHRVAEQTQYFHDAAGEHTQDQAPIKANRIAKKHEERHAL